MRVVLSRRGCGRLRRFFGYRQAAKYGIDVVVLRQRAFGQFVSERVIGLAHLGLRAGDGIRGTFALDKAVASYGHIVLRVAHERRAIEGLAGRGARKRDIARCNFKRADLLAQRVVRFFGGAIPRERVGVAALAGVGLAARGGEGRGLAVHETRDFTFGNQGTAVIRLAGIGRGNDELGRRNLVAHVERALVAADALNRYGDRTRIRDVVGVHELVVFAFDQCVARGFVGQSDRLLLRLAVVHDVFGLRNGETAIGVIWVCGERRHDDPEAAALVADHVVLN